MVRIVIITKEAIILASHCRPWLQLACQLDLPRFSLLGLGKRVFKEWGL